MNLLVSATTIKRCVIDTDDDVAEGDCAKVQPPRPATRREFDDALRNSGATAAAHRDRSQYQAERGCG